MCGSVYGYPASKVSLGRPGHAALTLPLSLLSPRIIMLCHCSSTMATDHFLMICYGTKGPLCVDVPLNTDSFIRLVYFSFAAKAASYLMLRSTPT